jgi:tetratricopeptide (TPR) repeat protein
VLTLAIVLPGCGPKLSKKGMPFELDKVFRGLFLVETETARDKGLRLVRERDYNGAIDAFKIAVIESPEDFFGFNALAVCHKNLGDNAKAMQNYERAFELARSPEERAKVLSNIGNLYSTARKHQVALGFYKEAQNESPQNPMYLILIARTFIYLDELPRAQKVVKAAEDIIVDLPKYERDEDRGLGHYLMAQVYLALDEEENLFKALEKSIRANPQKFLKRLEMDASDETNLFFTMRDEPRLKKLLKGSTG